MSPLSQESGLSLTDGRWKQRWERLLHRERLARERLEILAEAGKILSSSLDYEIVVGRVIELAVPLLGGFGFFDLVEGEGEVRRLTLAPDDPRRQGLLDRTRWVEPNVPLRALTSSGEPEFHSRIDEGWLARTLPREDLALFHDLQVSSLLVVPLLYQHRTLGTLTLFFGSETRRRHGTADLAVGVELAQRAAAALENARLFRQVQEAVRKRDEFLSVASHELKTPLTTLELQVTALLRGLKLGRLSPEETDVVVDRLDRVERQVQRLNHIIEDLLDATRLAGERLRLRRGDVDLQELVEQAVRRLQPELERSGSEVQLSLENLHYPGDRPRLEQVVVNLLSNAVRYGSGRPVEISLGSRPGGVRIQVADHGIGISPEDQARIFERFERAVSPRKYSGLGMGLWVARQIVEAHGGQIGVISVHGVGSAFTVDLPI